MRKNIFELIQGDYKFNGEALKIEKLLQNKSYDYMNGIEQEVNENYYKQWKYRDTTISVNDLRKTLKVTNAYFTETVLDLKRFLIYLEYVLNIVTIAYENSSESQSNQLTPIFVNIDILLNHFNFERRVIDVENVKVIIIEKNPAATTVAEIVEDDNISKDIIRYNHFMLKGDIHEKKKILSQLYKEYEKIKQDLNNNGYGKLKDDLGFMFNALKIRHDEAVNKTTENLVKDMKDEEIEEWCDRVYDIFLLAELSVNYINDKDKIKWLKTGE